MTEALIQLLDTWRPASRLVSAPAPAAAREAAVAYVRRGAWMWTVGSGLSCLLRSSVWRSGRRLLVMGGLPSGG
jgi:hypothetical protein